MHKLQKRSKQVAKEQDRIQKLSKTIEVRIDVTLCTFESILYYLGCKFSHHVDMSADGLAAVEVFRC